jgi:flagellar biosynthesis/type III secretory pathway protein FliH
MSLIKSYLHTKMMDNLEMLTAREQLMEDIDCIIESNFGEVEYKDDVIRQLCDAVCKNFPTK